MSGTAVAQAIGFALSPVVSRLFTPTDFGIFGTFNVIAGIITAAVTLEYSQAIMLPPKKEDALNLFAFSLACAMSISFLVILFCTVAPARVNALMKTHGFLPLAFLVLATLAAGVNEACQAWSVRVKAFKHTSASQIIRSVSSSGMRIGLGYFKAGATGLIISSILANILATLNLLRVLLPDIAAFRNRIRWQTMKKLASEYRDFPMYSASQSVINAISSGLPVLLLTRYFGIAVAGAYAFGGNVLQLPMGFVLTALRQVLFQKACENQHEGKRVSALYIKTTVGLFATALLPSAVLIIWGPQLFSWVFGSQWLFAGKLAQSLIIWLAVSFCNLPAVLFAKIIRIQRFVFFYDIALLIMRSLALVIGGLYFNAQQTVLLFALVGSVMNAYLIVHVGRVVIKSEGSMDWGNRGEAMGL
jgi:O-antigen/teichoic acid export membrane protein